MPAYQLAAWVQTQNPTAVRTTVLAPITGSLDNLAHLTGSDFGAVIEGRIVFQEGGNAAVPQAPPFYITPTKLALNSLNSRRNAPRRGRR